MDRLAFDSFPVRESPSNSSGACHLSSPSRFVAPVLLPSDRNFLFLDYVETCGRTPFLKSPNWTFFGFLFGARFFLRLSPPSRFRSPAWPLHAPGSAGGRVPLPRLSSVFTIVATQISKTGPAEPSDVDGRLFPSV